MSDWTKERRCILHPEMPCPAKSDDDVCLCLHPDALERAVVTSPTEDERLKRLHLLVRSLIFDADIKWIVGEYDRLTEVFEEACREIRACHDTPCYCKYCHEDPTPREVLRNG